MTQPKNATVVVRMDGRVEWLCKHGVGHPVVRPGTPTWGSTIHGCDGCCASDEPDA